MARAMPGYFPGADYTLGAGLRQAQQPCNPPGANNMQLQQQYDTLLGDLAAQRQSQPRWPQRSRNSLMPLSSAQQLQQLQEEHLPIEQWPVQALAPLHQLHDLQHPMMPASDNPLPSEPLPAHELACVGSDASTAGPADAVLCKTATAAEALAAAVATQTSIAALHTPSASIQTSSSADSHKPFAQPMPEHRLTSPEQADSGQSATLPQLPEDPFAQTTPKSHIPPARKHALPEELFCQHTSSAPQSKFPLSQPIGQQEMLLPLDATSTSVPSAFEPASSAVRSLDAASAETGSRLGNLASLAELSQASVTQAAGLSQPSVSSPDSNQRDRSGFYPGGTALSSRTSAVRGQPDDCPHTSDRQQRAVASADSLASDGGIMGDGQGPLPDRQQAVTELRLRASLVEWLADAVATRLAVAFQSNVGAAASAKPTAEEKTRAGSVVMSGECPTTLLAYCTQGHLVLPLVYPRPCCTWRALSS